MYSLAFNQDLQNKSQVFSRKFNKNRDFYTLNDKQAKDHYIYNDGLPSLRNYNDLRKKIDDSNQIIDQKIVKSYQIDDRIKYISSQAVQNYNNQKESLKKLAEDKLKEETLILQRKSILAEKRRIYNQKRIQTRLAEKALDLDDTQDTIIMDSPQQFYDRQQLTKLQKNIMAKTTIQDVINRKDIAKRQVHSQGTQVIHNNQMLDGKSEVQSVVVKSEIIKNNSDFNLKRQNIPINVHKYDQHIKPDLAQICSNKNSKRLTCWEQQRLVEASNHCQACKIKYSKYLTKENKPKISTQVTQKLLLRAKKLIYQKKLKSAVLMLENAIKAQVYHADIFYLIGETKRLLGEVQSAERYLLSALQYEVHSPYVYQSLGLCYIKLKHYDKAIQLLKHFLTFNETDDIHFEIGKCLTKLKNYIEAAVYFSNAIDINQDKGIYYLYRGDVYEALGFTELSVSDFTKFRELTPEYKDKFGKQINMLESNHMTYEADILKGLTKKINKQ